MKNRLKNLFRRAEIRSGETGQWENGWIDEIEEEAWDGICAEQQMSNDLVLAAGGDETVFFEDFSTAKNRLEIKVKERFSLPRSPYVIAEDYQKLTNTTSPVLKMRFQPTGDCVGNGMSRAIETLLLELWDSHHEYKPRPVHPSYIYGGARMLTNITTGAGASVAHAAKFVNQYGVLFEDSNIIKPYEKDTEISTRLGRNWNSEEMKNYIKNAKNFLVSVIKLPNRNNMDAVNLALDSGAKIVGGFRRRFVGSDVRRYGVKFGRLSGTWNHCVACVGRFKEPVPGYAFTNSHGNRYTGDCVLKTPSWATNITPTDAEELFDNSSIYAVSFIYKSGNKSKPDWRFL
jgi:hypothetical protein